MRAHALFGAVALAVGSTLSVPAGATPIYDETINTGSVAYAVTPATVSDFINCFTSFGCMGKAGQVWSDPVNLTPSAVSTIPVTIDFTFTLTPQQQAELLAAPAGTVGQFFLTAGRDIGIRQGPNPDPDFLPTSFEGIALGMLFQAVTSTCPAGERGAAYPADLVCGPNYHTDVAATDVLTIPLADLIAAAGDSNFTFTLTPSTTIGRLIIFSAELRIEQPVPEPGTMALVGLALAGLAMHRRRRAERS